MLGSTYCSRLTIPIGTKVSNVIDATDLSDARSIMIYGPAALDVATFTIEVSFDDVTWCTLNDGTADIPVPGANKAISYFDTQLASALFLRLVSSGNVAADRVFKVSKQLYY